MAEKERMLGALTLSGNNHVQIAQQAHFICGQLSAAKQLGHRTRAALASYSYDTVVEFFAEMETQPEIVCHKCGTINPPLATMCRSCDADLPNLADERPALDDVANADVLDSIVQEGLSFDRAADRVKEAARLIAEGNTRPAEEILSTALATIATYNAGMRCIITKRFSPAFVPEVPKKGVDHDQVLGGAQ